MGKLPNEDLKQILGCIKKGKNVVFPPQMGFDAGVHLMDDGRYMVVSTDPCVGVPEEWFGWLLIHYVASDIALFGAKTEYFTINLLGPSSALPSVFHKVMHDACNAANELGANIITGHTGTYNGLSTLVGVCTGYGHINKNKLKTPAQAKDGDIIICIKPVGLETAVNFALTHKEQAEKIFGTKRTLGLTKLVTLQSCVNEALSLVELGGVNAMHDATEGGVIVALNEMAEASNVGFVVDYEKLLIPKEVEILKDFYGLSDTQMLSMSSTGTILAAISPESKSKVETFLRQNKVDVRFLGNFTGELNRLLIKNKKKQEFPSVADDPYERLFLEK
jgi:hydrogenase expression/formation protein HypE